MNHKSKLAMLLKIFVISVFISICSCTVKNAIGNSNIILENPNCEMNGLQLSQEMIKLILDDLSENYDWVSGGGIQQIKQLATHTYIVLISQEERTVEITYEFSEDSECNIAVVSRVESAIAR